MARRSVAYGSPLLRPGSSTRAGSRNRRLQISPALERKWFEFDRNTVTGALDKLQRAIQSGSTQMDMIAAEQMFDSMLSKAFSRTAQRLDRLLLKLKQLSVEVNGATGYPKTWNDCSTK